MSPRPYRLGQREASVELTRSRILTSARDLLAAEADVAGFTVDTVAHQAGVARMTVYYHFGSKRGLLEALFDTLAARGLVGPLQQAFAQSDPVEALDRLVDAFCLFWASDRVVIRRLRSLGALDQEIGQSIRARDQRRHHALTTISTRLVTGGHIQELRAEQLDVLHTLTSFEVFDMLAGANRTEKEAAQLVTRMVHTELRLSAAVKTSQQRRKPRRDS
jgi:AcrR family transcriptional regulator